ncbi:MAG TPA: phosphate ABC transporter permease PstA [Candidatus Krumholzibacteriaceae bacterium]|nr:phosphate ABC transporter permease PstA [Candidatus Krumholzibacteriaceae bacterium]
MNSYLKSLRTYLKTHEREKIFAGLLICICGGLSASYGILLAVSVVTSGISGSSFLGALPFTDIVADLLLSLLCFATAVPLFLAGYLLAESHYGGIVIAGIFGIGSFITSIFGITIPALGLTISVLCLIGTLLGLWGQRKTIRTKTRAPVIEENVMKLCLRLCGLIAVGCLFFVIAVIFIRGMYSVSWDFVTKPWPVSWSDATAIIEGVKSGIIGIGPQIAGSLLLCGLCELISIPLGLGSAIYLSEYAPQNLLTKVIRFFIETLAGIPSVILGLFGFTFFAHEFGWAQRSLLGGAICLAFMILPWNIRIAEESIKRVSADFKAAAYALGSTKLQTIRHVILAAAAPGILTGILLGFGAAFGEAAVVLFAAGNEGALWPSQLTLTSSDIPTLPGWIYGAFRHLTQSQDVTQGGWREQNVAFAGSLVLIFIFLAVTVAALLVRNHFNKKLAGT